MHFKTIQTGLFISLLVIATILFGWLIHDYVLPVFWAVVLTILFYPIHQRIYAFTKQRASLSALLSISFILIVVLVPLYVLATLVASEAISLYASVSQTNISSQSILAQIHTLLIPFEQFGIDIQALEGSITSFMQNISAQVGGYALDIGRATANTVIATLLTLYILFFTFRDGSNMGTRIMEVLPLGDEKEKMLFTRFVAIVHAMFKGTFIIALIQALIGGVLFFAVGIKSAILWAVVMALFALIPAIGPAIVWLPAALLLLAVGNIWQGVIVLVVGTVIISVIDNLLRPVLVAKGAAMPDVLILLSVLGGLTMFGIAGIIIGPVITAFFLSMWQLFEHDYARELKKHG